jgi:hypothetical protein
MGKYTKNDLPIIFGLNPDINEIIIKDAITYIHGHYSIFPLFSISSPASSSSLTHPEHLIIQRPDRTLSKVPFHLLLPGHET